jgi:DNA-binding transcriptional ArsR family regulator
MSSDPSTEDDLSEYTSKAEMRLENPSGWLLLTKHDSVPIIIDALLCLPPRRELNKTELAEHAGVSRQSVTNHIDLLLALDVLEEVPDTSPTRYRMPKSAVVKELFELNSALNAAGIENEPPESYGSD